MADMGVPHATAKSNEGTYIYICLKKIIDKHEYIQAVFLITSLPPPTLKEPGF